MWFKNLSRNQSLLLRGLLGLSGWLLLSQNELSTNPIRVIGQGIIVIGFLLFMETVTPKKEDHVVYIPRRSDDEVRARISSLGYQQTEAKGQMTSYKIKEGWSSKIIKLTKTDHYLKVELPKELVPEFEDLVTPL